MKGLLCVIDRGDIKTGKEEYIVQTECTPEEENQGLLQVIYEDGKFFNTVNLSEIRTKLKSN